MSRRKSVRSILGSILVMVVVMGCSAAGSTPTPTPSATPTPTPSATPTPTPTPTPDVGPGGFPRRFHVEGNAFVDQFHQKMVFRGIASMDPAQLKHRNDPGNPDYATYPDFNEKYFHAMASWGANIVRVPLLPWSLQTYGEDAVLQALDQAIAWAGENKMYVAIDFSCVGWLAAPDVWFLPGGGFDTTVGMWTRFWDKVSSRYVHNDVVAFYELFGAPALNPSHWPYTREDWLAWKGLAESLIKDTIRPNDPAKTLLVGGLNADFNLSFVAHDPIVDSANNVAYTTEPYSSHLIAHEDWNAYFGDVASQYAVFAIEFGYDSCCADSLDIDVDGTPYHRYVIDYLEARHISWTVWSFSASWTTRLLKDNTTFEPSESGAYFKSRMLELDGPPSP